MDVSMRGKSRGFFLFQPLILSLLLVVMILFAVNNLQAAQDNLNPDPAPNSTPTPERARLLDYGAILKNLSQDLTRGKETAAADTAQWEILRKNLAQRDLKIKEYRVHLSSFAKTLIAEDKDLKKLQSDWNFLKPMIGGLDDSVRQTQNTIQILAQDFNRVDEKISLNHAYSNEVMAAVDTSNSEAARLKKNFKELEQIYQSKKKTLTEILDAGKKNLAEMLAVKRDFQSLSEKFAQELLDRKKEVRFEREIPPLGSISLVDLIKEVLSLYPRSLEVLRDYPDKEKGYGNIAMNLGGFTFLLAIWLIMLIRLRSFLHGQIKKRGADLTKPLEDLLAMARHSLILLGVVLYFYVYGLMVDGSFYKAGLTLFLQLIMAFLFVDWLIVFLEFTVGFKALIDPRRLAFWSFFLRGLFPFIALNLVLHQVFAYNHMIPVVSRLFLELYLLVCFFVMTFRLRLTTGKDEERVPRPLMLKLTVTMGNLILLAGLLMELFGYGPLAIYWYVSWVYSVAVLIWGWSFFSILLDLRSRQKLEVTRDPYFSHVVSHGHPVKWFLLQVGWVVFWGTIIVLMVLAWSWDWAVVVRIFLFLNHSFVVGGLAFSIMNFFYAAFTLGATHVATRLWKHLLLNKILVDSGFEDSAQNSISMITVYTMWVFGILLALHVFGFGTTSLTVAFGALGIGLGFGLQNIFNNFISGIILLFERPIKVGDDIEVNGVWASVKKINVRSTIVQTYDNAALIIPNSDFISAQVTNWTLRDKRIRRKIKVRVTYGSDVKLVHDTLLEIGQSNSKVLAIPQPDVLFADLGESSLDFILRVWTNVDLMLLVDTEIRFEIYRVFKERGISLAFPQLDVHLDHRTVKQDFIQEG
ncbi:MAG: mechanosensitive ion channel [Desulfobacterium sp.]|nr:mechanosensitive ion channel [Desulfobacterium sp.]